MSTAPLLALVDCPTGLAGNMLLAALLDLGLPEAVLAEPLAALGLAEAYRFDCRRPETLKQIKTLLFQQLPKLERLDVEMVTPAGQRSQRLVPGQDTIVLP